VTKLPLQHKIRNIGMMCFSKFQLMEDLYIVQIKNYHKHATCAIRTLDERPSVSITDKPIFSSERMFQKDCDLKGSVQKIPGRDP
jgi:hypothetical protein